MVMNTEVITYQNMLQQSDPLVSRLQKVLSILFQNLLLRGILK